MQFFMSLCTSLSLADAEILSSLRMPIAKSQEADPDYALSSAGFGTPNSLMMKSWHGNSQEE